MACKMIVNAKYAQNGMGTNAHVLQTYIFKTGRVLWILIDCNQCQHFLSKEPIIMCTVKILFWIQFKGKKLEFKVEACNRIILLLN